MLKDDYEKAKAAIKALKESAGETYKEEIDEAEKKLEAAKENAEEETVKTAGKVVQKLFGAAFKILSTLPGGERTAWGVISMFLNMGSIAEGVVRVNWIGIISLAVAFAAGLVVGKI